MRHVLWFVWYMNESGNISTSHEPHIWMRHVLWFVWYMNESGNISTSHEPHISMKHCLWVISHTNQLCAMSGVTYQWVANIWMSHVTYECVTCMNEACVMSHIIFESVTHMNKACNVQMSRTHECGTSRSARDTVKSDALQVGSVSLCAWQLVIIWMSQVTASNYMNESDVEMLPDSFIY